MSRSFKKTPYCGDKKGKDKKRIANHKVKSSMKNKDWHPRRKLYKKIYEQYDICDYYEISSFEEYKNYQLRLWEEYDKNRNIPKPTEKELYRDWYKSFKMK